MMKLAACASIFVVLCFITMSSGYPSSLESDLNSRETMPRQETDDFNSRETVTQKGTNELHIWSNELITNSPDIALLNPKPVDTTLNCPSCLPDALLPETQHW